MYSYVVLRKPEGKVKENSTRERIIGSPLKRDKHVIIDVCAKSGLVERRIYSKGKMKEDHEKYRGIRKAEWGGVISSE